MSDLPAFLSASLSPATRKEAERQLHVLSQNQGFLSLLLGLVLDPSQDRAVRLAGSIYFKNLVKSKWDDEETPVINQTDKETIRNNLVEVMIRLASPADKTLRAQIAESISLIASVDFPDNWSNLIQTLVTSLSTTDFSINLAILQTAHSIFQRWRSETRSDSLFSTINFVLSTFAQPFYELFTHTATLLLSTPPSPTAKSTLELLAQCQVLLVDIFYDLTCQDLPPILEDNHDRFYEPHNGLFLKLLNWDPAELRGDPEDTVPSLPSQIKTGILEITEMYIKLYPEILQAHESVKYIMLIVWDMVGGGKRTGLGDDGMVSQALRFISTSIRSGHYKELFSSQQTIAGLVQGVVHPNISLREHEIEQFEDEPLEYIRRDLSMPSASGGLGLGSHDVLTRRQAAADVLRSLGSSGLEAETTEVALTWINQGLQEYSKNQASEGGWKAKDTAIYLYTAIASRASTASHGVTSTNPLVNVVNFFSEHIFQDLQAEGVHPILQVDAIRYLHTFRTQLTKDQLLAVVPLLARHLGSENYVSYTYAAISIERILAIRQGPISFAQADIQAFAPDILESLLLKLESATTPEKVAENDYLMRCVMRVIMIARSSLHPTYSRILQRLVGILGVISRNPSNPAFDQYIFESISALIRFIVVDDIGTLPHFEEILFPPATIILQQDIDQYIPYVFQILAQMLELHRDDEPADRRAAYRGLLPDLLVPTTWQQKGSIPGLVKLLKAFLLHDTQQIVAAGQFVAILGIIQQRLIPSKLHDGWGFELLQAVLMKIPIKHLDTYFRLILVTLLTRLQTSKTDGYTYHFVYFLLFAAAIKISDFSSDYLISKFEEIQPQLWSQVFTNFVIPKVTSMQPKDRKVATVGLIRLLTESKLMTNHANATIWLSAFIVLGEMLAGSQDLSSHSKTESTLGVTAVDFEEENAGYQAAYSRLAASESLPMDVVQSVQNPLELLQHQLQDLMQREQHIRTILQSDAKALKYLQSLGISV